MRISLSCTIAFILILKINSFSDSTFSLLPREPFEIELANLSVSFSEKNTCEKVRITFPDSKEYAIITSLDDSHFKTTRNGIQKTIYRENEFTSYKISSFESKQISLVNNTFIKTLETFEKDLQNNNWGKCLYLDTYLARFLKGYFYLLNTVQSTTDALPESANVPDTFFDISLNSIKSDNRIKKWRTTPEYIVKLRIATKELMYQLKLLQKTISSKENSDSDIIISKDFSHSLALFVSIYFNNSIQTKKPLKN